MRTLKSVLSVIQPFMNILGIKQSSPSVVQPLPYKSPGTVALIAFIGGIFALPGIGHIYVGKVGRGIGILILGLILYALLLLPYSL